MDMSYLGDINLDCLVKVVSGCRGFSTVKLTMFPS